MREQVIASRGSRGPSRPGREFVQRPARRDGKGANEKRSSSVRSLFRYVPSALRAIAAVVVLLALIIGYRAAASASLFQVRNLDISGTSRTSSEEIESLVRRAVARTGVWRADIAAISSELQRLPAVRRAVVTRVLPDRLRIRITERAPIAVVRIADGHFLWVDDEGVSLGEMKSTDEMPPFFIRGWNEDGSEDGIASNAERVQKYLELVHAWQAAGLADRVSEVNLIDTRDIRVQLAGDDSRIEVRLGGQDLTQRLQSALEVLDRYKQTAGGSAITYVDSQGGRVTLGFSSGTKLNADADSASRSNDAVTTARVTLKETGNNPSAAKMLNKKSGESNSQQTNSAKGNRDKKNDRSRTRDH